MSDLLWWQQTCGSHLTKAPLVLLVDAYSLPRHPFTLYGSGRCVWSSLEALAGGFTNYAGGIRESMDV